MMSRTALLRALLAAICLVCLVLQARSSHDSIRSLLPGARLARAPFSFSGAGRTVAAAQAEAREAGLREGDRVLEVSGASCAGPACLAAPVRRTGPGGRLEVVLEGGRTLSILLAPARADPAGPGEWIQTLVLNLAMPALCLLLGFWAAASRIRDPNAWLLLAILISFSRIADTPRMHWEGWWLPAGIVYHWFFVASWAIWMMLFGIRFPERFPLDRRLPWLKWALIVPLALLGAARIVVAVGAARGAESAARLDALLSPFETLRGALYMTAIGLFFALLGFKQGTTKERDARRRLLLLHAGAGVSLFPAFILAVRSLLFRGGMFDVPEWILAPSLLMLFGFPLTLAYVIVVHRALDVRVVIRQGLQYALARRGLMALQGLTIVAIIGGMYLLLIRTGTRRVEILAVLGAGLTFVVLIGRLGERLRGWIDRRFFREAYDAERILSDLGGRVRTMVQTIPLLETVALRISESLHVPQVAVLVENGGTYRPAYAVGFAGLPEAFFEAGAATVGRLTSSGEPLRVDLDDPRSWARREEPLARGEIDHLRLLGAQVLLPLAANERMPGFISLGAKQSEEPYSGGDLRLLQWVATQAGLALENSRLTAAIASEVAQRERLNREVEIAREVQERLFPQSLPAVERLDYRGSCRPALAVGGDYFDFLELPGGRLGVAIADVSGKGIGAALLMASLQASLRGQTIQGVGSLAATMANVNRLVYDASPENRYATFFYAQYDPASREMTYVNAGHCPPILLRRAGGVVEAQRLRTGGTVVGLFAGTSYLEGKVGLQPGDLVVAYTDGISEALDPQEEEWGEGSLIAAAAACDGLSAADTIQRIMTEADAFASGAPQHDDMTLVVLRVL